MDQIPGSFYWPPAQPGRRGLLAASLAVTQAAIVDYPESVDERWVNGFSYLADSCDAADPMGILCIDSPADKTPVDNPDVVTMAPFLTFGTDRCSTLDAGRPRAERARRNLLATESWQIEREFFDVVATKSTTPDGPNPYMTDNATATAVSATVFPAMQALAVLEEALLACLHGQRGMIHATSDLVTLWQAGGGLRLEGQTILTIMDTIIVPGTGYSGAGPDGTGPAAGSSWTYGTGLVYLLQGQILDPAAQNPEARIDRDQNTTTFIVERPNALLFAPCCVKAVHASLTS